ncbi:hypothetical protein IQ241_02305 [Romeria aff. gracilis LEGE 07310]|uniref:Thylakoid lumen protein n=1 Tax=Vasconcelosia minhoensis LEGE 07310 TaxID=915328 RepID=A0A8J7A550_9CYAN|nr:hypothetical protein [Romeria gracilis]MBE9076135.1 hypothetical protein [Romeria aff. gracilis LEGE 07310]
MSNSVLHAFFIGRALATAVGEQVEHLVSDGLSLVGKFDAEQRENLRQFTEEVMARAEREEAIAIANQPAAAGDRPTASGKMAMAPTEDLQATIDNLRAEIAQVRATLQQYRSPS